LKADHCPATESLEPRTPYPDDLRAATGANISTVGHTDSAISSSFVATGFGYGRSGL